MADNKESGLRLLMRKRFDLIITQIVMPVKDTIESILAIRKESGNFPIISISGVGKVDPAIYLEMAHSFGADHTFLKPLNVKSLLSTI